MKPRTFAALNIRRLSVRTGLAVALSLAGPGFSQTGPARAGEADAPLQLPKVTVSSARLADYPPMPKADLSGGGLAPTEPPVSIFFPGAAYAAAIPKGYATVCVELDETGRAVDFLLISYTQKYFGDALLSNARDTKYSPLLFKGVAIPSRFNFGYEFRPEITLAMTNIDAIEHRQQTISGGRPEYKYFPVIEADLDGPLEVVRQAVPNFPAGYKPAGGKADSVMVTLFIDEEGRVRVPNVESASSPLLVPNALKAVHFWRFKPPVAKGKPVLVYAAFVVNFMKVEK